jgi:cytochrome bd-type quinol oxidase subunit 2
MILECRMSKSILGLPHILLAIITLVSYILLALTILYQKVTAQKKKVRIRVLAMSGLIGIFLLVDTGFYMYRIDQIFTHQLHHPIALAAMFIGAAASMLAILAKRSEKLLQWALYLSITTIVLCVLTSLFSSGK